MIPFFSVNPAIQKIIYTTTAMESLNRSHRENGAPSYFLTLLIPQTPEDARLFFNRRLS